MKPLYPFALATLLVLLGCTQPKTAAPPLDPADTLVSVIATRDDMKQELPGGLDWIIHPKWTEKGTPDGHVFIPSSHDPIAIQVTLFNRSDETRSLPEGFFRAGTRPALRDGVTLHILHAPFNDHAASVTYPDIEQDFTEIHPLPLDHFSSTQTRRFESREAIEDFTLDLRSVIPDLSPGYYQFHFEFNPAKLNLPNEPVFGASQVSYEFTLGIPPRLLSPAELNRSIPPLGSPDAVARLEKLIRDQFPTNVPSSPPEPADFSPSQNGLAIRVDAARYSPPASVEILLRIKNTSNAAITLPAGWQDGITSRVLLDDNSSVDGPKASAERYQIVSGGLFGNVKEIPPSSLTLGPGQSVGLYAASGIREQVARQITVTLNLPKQSRPAAWSGAITSAPATFTTTWPASNICAPTFLTGPESPNFGLGGNGNPGVAVVEGLDRGNYRWIEALSCYDPASRRARLEALIAAENAIPERAYLSAIAAAQGSRTAALELLTLLKRDDPLAREIHTAVGYALEYHIPQTTEVLGQLAAATLLDQRYMVPGKSDDEWSSSKYLQLAYFDDDLVRQTGWAKIPQAIPALEQRLHNLSETEIILFALGNMGDPRAIPVVLRQLEARQPNGSIIYKPDAARAVGKLKATDAIPILLRHLDDDDAIEALRLISDPRAKEPLQKLLTPDHSPHQRFMATMALAWMAGEGGTPDLCRLASDQSLDQYDRRDAIWRLGDRPDPRAIPTLISAIKNDPSGAVVNQAITVLSVYKYKAAVTGLIDCFNADFKGKQDWKRAYSPETYQANIANALRQITNQPLGTDPAKWAQWWTENQSKSNNLR